MHPQPNGTDNLDAEDTAPEATNYGLPCWGEICPPGPRYSRTWRYWAEKDVDGISDRFSNPVAGRVWFHTSTRVGLDLEHPALGFHRRLDGSEADSLSNAYLDVSIFNTAETVFVEGQQLDPHIVIHGCPQCRKVLENPFDWRAGEAIVLARTLWPEIGPLGYVTSVGTLERAQSGIAPGAQAALLKDNRVWASANHANPSVGMAGAMPVAVALDFKDGGRIVDLLWAADGQLLSLEDIRLNGALAERLGKLGIDDEMPRAASMAPRKAFNVVHDATHGRVFVIGGRNGEKYAGDLWVYNVVGRTWHAVRLGEFALKEVLAAALAPDDGRLWAIDRDPKEGLVRLVSIDLAGGPPEVLHKQKAESWFTKVWLGLDYAGNLLASCSREDQTLIFHLAGNKGLEVLGTLGMKGTLLVEPVADIYGLKLFFAGNSALDVRRISSLEPGGNIEAFRSQCLR